MTRSGEHMKRKTKKRIKGRRFANLFYQFFHSARVLLSACSILIICSFVVCSITACSKKETSEETDSSGFDQSRGCELLETEQLPDAPEGLSVKGMKLVSETDSYALYLDTATSDLAVLEKSSQKITHSNPFRAGNMEEDEVRRGLYGSVLELNYTNLAGKTGKYNSYTNSVQLEQFTYYKIDHGVRIVYVLGLDESKRILPPVLSVETYNRILDKLSEDEKADFKPMFRLLKQDKLNKAEKDSLLEKYPKLQTDNLYVQRELKKYDKNLLEQILKTHGFTLEEVEAEIEYAGFEREESNVIFTVPVDAAIDEQGFTASVDLAFLEEPEEFKITTLTLLRGFGATQAEEGFLFIPDGSGVLYDLVSTDSTVYSKQLYGADPVISAPYQTGYLEQAILPVFGISAGEQSLFAVIEEGAAVSSVVVNSKTPMIPFACACPEITVNAKDYQDYGNLKTNPSGLVLPADPPTANIKVRYFFLNHPDVTYAEMAVLYRNYLLDSGVLNGKKSTEKTPFYVELPGAIQKQTQTAGIPYNKYYALTSYKQAQELLTRLLEQGANGLRLRYTGCLNGGIFNSVIQEAEFVKALGSKNEREELLAFAKEHGIEVFFEAEFTKVYKDGYFDGFKYSRDAARQLDHKVAITGRYNPSSLAMEKAGRAYLLSPVQMLSAAQTFFKDDKDFNGAGVSVGSVGRMLASDYKVGASFTREKSEEYYQKLLYLAEQTAGKVMTEKGNFYTWKAVSDIVDLPIGGSDMFSQQQAVPFVPMVLHGFVDYAGMPLNLASDFQYELLKAIETGAGIYVQAMYAEDLIVVDTEYDYMYSMNYKNMLEDAVKIYQEAAAVLDQVAGELMSAHEKVAEHGYAVTYENGIQILVNYAEEAFTYEGTKVPARGYAVREVR